MNLRFKLILLFTILLLNISTLLAQGVTIDVQNPDCNDPNTGMLIVNVPGGSTGPYIYKWQDQNEETLNNTRPGVHGGYYKVTVFDKYNCVGTASIVLNSLGITASISGPDGIEVSANGCNENDKPEIKLTASGTGGTGGYFYDWGDGFSTNPETVLTEAGNQTVIVKDTLPEGCEDSKSVLIKEIRVACSKDPNDIKGPDGYGPEKWVSINDKLPYRVRFENDPVFATAAALRVQVDIPLDEHVNPQSLRLGDFGFANLNFTVPDNQVFYSRQLDVTDSLDIFVQVTAGIDLVGNKAFWILESIDPATGLNPTNADLGLLPVNDTITRKGEGYVSFTLQPENTTLTGDTIVEFANIIFDENEAILTNREVNTIDAFAPTSTMEPIVANSTDTEILLSWTGMDDVGGVGLNTYDLYYSRNGNPFQLYEAELTTNSFSFPVLPATEYAFYTIATDYVGNREAAKTAGEVFFNSATVPTISFVSPLGGSFCHGDSITIAWNTFEVDFMDILFSEDGVLFNPIATGINTATQNFVWEIPENITCENCQFQLVNTEAETISSSNDFNIFSVPTISAGQDTSICVGSSITLEASGGVSYKWTPDISLVNPNSPNPIVAPTENTLYFLEGMDEHGCQSTDELAILVNDLPTATIPPFDTIFCANEVPVELSGIPTGGNFVGYSVANNFFRPQVTGPGNFVLSYIYTDDNGCQANANQSVLVFEVPEVDFTGLADNYFGNDAEVTLTGTPAGGSFSGAGINGNIFDPALATPGVYTIDYTFTDENTCMVTSSQTVTVYNNTTVFFNGLAPDYCENEPAISLNGNPQGGVFSGPGISGNSFDPTLAGVGTHEVIYTFNGESFTEAVTILPVTDLSIAGVEDAFCMVNEPVIINGNPVGGTLSGPGVNGNYFDLTAAGPGDHLIIYTYENTNGCTSVRNEEVTIFELPTVTFTGLAATYSDTDAAVVLEGSPMGGTFSGNGIVDSLFDPGIVANGIHLITYTYTNQLGCSNSYSQEVEVNALNTVFLSGLATTYCQNDPTVMLTGNPAGGTFSGPGILDNNFNPNIAGAGFHTITYTVTLSDGTTSTASNNTNVTSIPDITISNLADAYCITADDVQLIASPFGGEWSGAGISDLFFSPEQAGVGSHVLTYSYSDNNTGCTAIEERIITVGEPVIASIENLAPVYCLESEAALLTLIPAGGTLTGNGIVNETFFPSLAGEGEHLIVYDYVNDGGCTASFSATVLVTASINAVSIAGLESLVCENTPSIELTGVPAGGTFSGPGIVDNIFTPGEVGTVEITYSLSFGDCGATHTETIEVLAAPNLAIEAIPGTAVCESDTITLNANGGFSYVWSTGDTLGSIQVANSGTYELVTTGTNGCTEASDISVVVYEVGQPTISQVGMDSLISTSGDAYQWYLNGDLIAGANDVFFIPVTGGDYTVQVTDNNSCTAISNTFPFVITGVHYLTLDNISIHPNPAKDYVTIAFTTRLLLNDLFIEILDTKGSLIWQKRYGDVNSDFNERINVGELTAGVYQMKVLSSQGTYVEKLVVVR